MKQMRFLAFIILSLSLVLFVIGGGEPVDDPLAGDLLQDLKTGVRTVGKLFGIETIKDVAKLVAKGFSRQGLFLEPEANTPMQQKAASTMILLWRLIGLDGGKLAALIMNALVFVAHVIATNIEAFRKPGLQQNANKNYPKPEELWDLQLESPLRLVLKSPSKQFRSVLESIHGGNVTDHLESGLDTVSHALPEDSDCIMLLICKIKPLIKTIQQVARELFTPSQDGSESPEDPENIAESIFRSVPTLKEVEANRVQCEAQFTQCAFLLR